MKEIGLDEIKKLQLGILEAFADFCERRGLTYFLAYGTLIGAVRHQGYIPWDDDIDVIMPRPDYLRFIDEFSHDRYAVFCPEHQSDCPFVYGKLYDTHTYIVEQASLHYQIGLNMDIFVLDGMPSDATQARKHIRRCSFWLNIADIKKITFSKKRSLLKNAELAILKTLLFAVPYRVARDRIVRLSQKYALADCDYCSDLSYTGALHMRRELFAHSVPGKFEGRTYPLPDGYDEWLARQYGDYMQLPPVEQRATHHAYKAFLKNE